MADQRGGKSASRKNQGLGIVFQTQAFAVLFNQRLLSHQFSIEVCIFPWLRSESHTFFSAHLRGTLL
jgi:hypothetical protein